MPSGKPADTIRNRPELASAIQLALEKREADQAAALAAIQAKLDTAGKPMASAAPQRRNEASLRNHIEVDSKTGRPTLVAPTPAAPGTTPPADETSNAAPPPPPPIGGSINPESGDNFDFQLARAVDLLRGMAKFAKKPN